MYYVRKIHIKLRSLGLSDSEAKEFLALLESDQRQCAIQAEQGASMILSDNETKVDLLNNEAIAKTIVNLLRERPDHPITVGVHGDWGVANQASLR